MRNPPKKPMVAAPPSEGRAEPTPPVPVGSGITSDGQKLFQPHRREQRGGFCVSLGGDELFRAICGCVPWTADTGAAPGPVQGEMPPGLFLQPNQQKSMLSWFSLPGASSRDTALGSCLTGARPFGLCCCSERGGNSSQGENVLLFNIKFMGCLL